MPSYIEYSLDDGSTILIEVEEHGGVVRASNKLGETTPSKLNFKQAFASARTSIKEVIAEFDDLHIDDAEIKFGLKSIGEAGNIAIGKVGGEINFEVTLKWKKPEKAIEHKY